MRFRLAPSISIDVLFFWIATVLWIWAVFYLHFIACPLSVGRGFQTGFQFGPGPVWTMTVTFFLPLQPPFSPLLNLGRKTVFRWPGKDYSPVPFSYIFFDNAQREEDIQWQNLVSMFYIYRTSTIVFLHLQYKGLYIFPLRLYIVFLKGFLCKCSNMLKTSRLHHGQMGFMAWEHKLINIKVPFIHLQARMKNRHFPVLAYFDKKSLAFSSGLIRVKMLFSS